MQCPRRKENPPGINPREDDTGKDGCCTYCGSLLPELFIQRLEQKDVILEPTDKNYKVYVKNKGGEKFKQTYRTDEKPFVSYDSEDHQWVTRELEETKFYFQHLSEDQRKRFIELMNDKNIIIDTPGYFYKMPFFMKVEDAKKS